MKLDDNYTAVKDTFGWTLTFSEERERTKSDGTKEKYTFEDPTYHTSLKQCLTRYLDKSTGPKDTVQEVLDEIKRVEKVITNLKLK